MAKANFKELIQSDSPLLIDFYATWCGPCKMMHPILQELVGKMGDEARVIKIDIDKNKRLAEIYEVMGVPTFLIFQQGEVKWRHTGATSLGVLKKALKNLIKSDTDTDSEQG